MCSITNKNSSHFDNIPSRVVKQSIYAITIHLSTIINSFFEHGIFPDLFKNVKVIPVYKNEPKESISNYGPVSILLFSLRFVRRLHIID